MNKKKTIIKKNYCKIIIEKNKVTKIYDKENNKLENFKKFINELSIYLLAKQLNLDFIPKLLSYNILERKIVIVNEGISLKELCEIKNCKTKEFLPHIKNIYNKLASYEYDNIIFDIIISDIIKFDIIIPDINKFEIFWFDY